MAKLVGRTKGLDQRKLKALEKLLKEAGVSGNVNITSGLRDHDEVFRIYNKRIRREKLDKIMPELSKKSKDMINQMILRSDYKGTDKPVSIKYSRKLGIAKIKKELENHLKKEGVSSVKAKAISGKVQSIRKDFGGFESSHLKGGKVDIPQYYLTDEVVENLRDKGYNIIKEDKVNVYDIAFPKSGVKGPIKTVEKKPQVKSISIEDKFQIPKNISKIPAWMKKHGWKGKDLGQLVDGKWQGYHPGDVIKPEAKGPQFDSVEDFEEFKEKEQPAPVPKIDPEEKISYEKDIAIRDEVDKIIPDIQSRPTHPAAVDTEPALGTLSQDELEQLDKEAIKQDSLPELPAPEVAPEQMPLDQPTPYGVYAKGTPEFKEAEEEQVVAAADGGFIEKEKIKEEAEMGPIFEGQKPVVQEPVLPKGKTITGEAPITPEQFQVQPDQPIQPTQPVQPPPTETVDEVVLEYVQEGKKGPSFEKLNQMVKEGKTTREEISETIKKYDKAPEPKAPEPEDVMAAHAREMGKKPGPMMGKALGLKKEEVETISKAPKPKPDVVKKSGLESVIGSIKGIPSDVDKKKMYDPDQYAKDMWEMDQKFQADIKQAMKDEAAADVELQKVEPYRFWHSMSTPAKIVSALGALVAAYTLPAEGAATAYNMINAVIDADVKAQKLDVEHAMRVRKEATRRATNAIERRARIVGNPETRFKMMQISQNLKANQAAKDMQNQKDRLKAKLMRNPQEAEVLFKYNPHMFEKLYTTDQIKFMRKTNDNYKKALKDNNVSNVINAANAMENTFMDIDWKKVKGKLKLMKYDIAEPSGAGDMALVFSFMKMLDPGSVVREGEFKTAAGMNPQYLYLARKWNKFMKGEMFTRRDRLTFMNEVNRMLKAKVEDAQRVHKLYSTDLTRQGYPATFVLGKPITLGVRPSAKVNEAIKSIMKEKGVKFDEAVKLFNAARKRVEAKKRGVKFDKSGKPVRPKDEGKPLIGNEQFPIQSRIW